MTKQYLIGLAIGPVQDFIAAARRTRDLWFGSYILSEVSKAAARAFKQSGAQLIFPTNGADLQPNNSRVNVGNKIMVIVKTDKPQDVLKTAKSAAEIYWTACAEQFKGKINVDETIWEKQASDVLELFGAWVCLEKNEDYGSLSADKGRKRLEQLLNARKNTREFQANPVSGDKIAKSSLDGLRESVLNGNLKLWQKRRLVLRAGEELDCIGVVKRLGGNDADQFTPLSRLAIDPWLRYLKSEQFDLTEIKEILGELLLTQLGLVSPVNGNDSKYDFFPYDGQLLYDFRLQAHWNTLNELVEYTDPETGEAIEHARNHLERLQKLMANEPYKSLPKPNPYMAILIADGDNMGALLNSMNSIPDHQKISEKL